MTALPSRFQYAYEAEVNSLLTRRFRIWVLLWIGIWLPWIFLYPVEVLLCGTLIGLGGWAGYKRIREFDDLQRLAVWMLIGASGISILLGGFDVNDSSLGGALFFSGIWHLLACILLPFTAWQAARPAAVILVLWLTSGIWFNEIRFEFMTPIKLIFASLIFWPGVLVCAFRTSQFGRRFESRMLREHQQHFSREVFDARKFHEALFPKPKLDGPLQFRYLDLPRAGIGGDFLHAAFDGSNRLNLVLLDVSGDGISAALTVHRLQGELERITAESSDASISPDTALEVLNRYVGLTLAPHGVYAFAMAIRIDTDGSLEWSGAGHTPAFIRRRNGRTEKLESTTWPLGASKEQDPLQCCKSTTLEEGDILIVHTDGACEEQSLQGDRLSYGGVEKMIREAKSPDDTFQWPEHFIELLKRFRGSGESLYDVRREDLLIVSVRRGPQS